MFSWKISLKQVFHHLLRRGTPLRNRHAGERLASFPFARPVVVLFPNVASPLVLFDDIVDKIAAQLGIDVACTSFDPLLSLRAVTQGMEGPARQEVDVEPDRTSPVGSVLLRVPLVVQGRTP